MTKQQAVAKARIALRQAVDRACIARGEAQWTNGYRAGRPDKEHELFNKEMRLFAQCVIADATVERRIRAFAKAVREAR